MAAVQSNADYAQGMARAFAGALIFGFPILMTMEMWWLGFYADPLRLALFLALGLPALFGLSYYAGFRDTVCWQDDALDALAAYAIGFVMSAAVLGLFAVITPEMSTREWLGTISIHALPGAIGALLARSQLRGGDDDEDDEPPDARRTGYVSQLFLMAIGALFLAFSVAPTEEMILIGYQMSNWHAIALILVSLGLLHAFVYRLGLPGQEQGHPSGRPLRTFLHFTLAGYAIALLLSLYILWTFGRTDGVHASELVKIVIVLGFPASLGAAAAGSWCEMTARKSNSREGIENPMARAPLLEWVTALCGLAVALGAIGYLTWEGLQPEVGGPVLVARAGSVSQTASGYTVEIQIVNQSRATASAVEVEGALESGGEPETANLTFDYVPGKGRREGSMTFQDDPRRRGLKLSVKGQIAP